MSKALGKCPLEGSWASETYQAKARTAHVLQGGSGGTHMLAVSRPPVLTWERHPTGHEDQLSAMALVRE